MERDDLVVLCGYEERDQVNFWQKNHYVNQKEIVSFVAYTLKFE